ncbi:MAG: hypothetical protein DRN81_01930 [Thermoproteota archaeon]|nr:MAG: hypothetical protein DRN81_01930 [Candidatus Korarchaeota archaeon]
MVKFKENEVFLPTRDVGFDKKNDEFVISMRSKKDWNKQIEIRILKQRGRVNKAMLMNVFDLSNAKLKKVT